MGELFEAVILFLATIGALLIIVLAVNLLWESFAWVLRIWSRPSRMDNAFKRILNMEEWSCQMHDRVSKLETRKK